MSSRNRYAIGARNQTKVHMPNRKKLLDICVHIGNSLMICYANNACTWTPVGGKATVFRLSRHACTLARNMHHT